MKSSLLALAFLVLSHVCHAQSVVPPLEQEGRKGELARLAYQQAIDKFDRADADKDGRLTTEETAKTLPFMAENFSRYDKNNDGFLSWEEFVGHNRWKK